MPQRQSDVIAEILKELIAAGLQGESLVAAVERIEQAQPKAQDATAERRRAKDRERYYIKVGKPPPKPPFTPKPTETTEEVLTSLLSSSISTTSTQKEGSKKERARKTQLPADWMPKTAHYAKAKRLGQSPSFVDQKADDLRDWARSKAIMRADWDATFNGFLKPRGNSNGSHRETLDERAIRLIDEAKQLEFAAGIGRADDSFGGPAGGPIIDSELSERRG